MEKPWPSSIDHAAFTALLAQHLPQVHAKIEDTDAGLLYCEMAVLERAAQAQYAIDPKLSLPHFEFVNEVLKRATPDVRNAIELSFLEGFLFGNADEKKAYEWMPEALRKGYQVHAKTHALVIPNP